MLVRNDKREKEACYFCKVVKDQCLWNKVLPPLGCCIAICFVAEHIR